jgi:hypothetical protein
VLPRVQALLQQLGPQPPEAGARKLQALPEQPVPAQPEPKPRERQAQAQKRRPELTLRALPEAARRLQEALARPRERRRVEPLRLRGGFRRPEELRSREDARRLVLLEVLRRLPGPAEARRPQRAQGAAEERSFWERALLRLRDQRPIQAWKQERKDAAARRRPGLPEPTQEPPGPRGVLPLPEDSPGPGAAERPGAMLPLRRRLPVPSSAELPSERRQVWKPGTSRSSASARLRFLRCRSPILYRSCENIRAHARLRQLRASWSASSSQSLQLPSVSRESLCS